MKRFFTLILTLLIACTSVNCLQASIFEQKFDLFSPKGLSSGTAYRVIQDNEGFIWVSTRNGIDRYDGSRFRHYRLNGNIRRGIHDGMMIYLYKDDAGELWVYTERSILYHYNRMTDTFEEAITFPPEDGVGSLIDMYVYGDEIIFGVSNGLMSYDMKNGKKRVCSLLNDREVRCISSYKDGCLLVGTNKGLALYDPVQHRATTIHDRFFVDVRAVCYNAVDNIIWAGSNGQGLYMIEENNNDRVTRLGNSQLVVYSLCQYSDHEVLAGTDGDGLQLAYRTENGYELTLFASDTEEAAYPIHCSCVRHVSLIDGQIWLAMHFGGVVRLQPASTMVEMQNQWAKSPSDLYVFGASFDQQDRVWVAYNQSIACYEPNGELKGWYLDHVARYLTVFAAPDGTVWCGGFNTGLYHFDPVTGKQEYFQSVRGSSSRDCVYSIIADTRGYIWVGGLDFGMTCIIPTQPRQIGDDPQKTLRFEHTSIRHVSDIDQVNDSVLAVATSDGLYLYNYYTQRQEHLFLVGDDAEWQGTNFFTSSAIRHGHEIWLASDGAGLLLYDLNTQKYQSFGLEHGLPSLQLRGVELVNDSTLCVASELDGLFSFDCKNQVFEHLLYFTEGSQFQQNSIATNGKGLVLAGCNYSAVLIGPDDMAPRQVETSIHIDGHPIIDETIRFSAEEANLSLTFSTTDIQHQTEYHFFYRIDGIDKDWVHLDEQRHLEYHMLPAGTYKMAVVAIGAGGQRFERNLSLVIERGVGYYLLNALYVILVIVALLGLHFYFSNRQRKRLLAK